MKITKEKYFKLNGRVGKSKVSLVAKQTGVSATTLHRIKKSRSFPDYKRIALADSNRGIKPYHTTNVEDVTDVPVKKVGFFSRFFG